MPKATYVPKPMVPPQYGLLPGDICMLQVALQVGGLRAVLGRPISRSTETQCLCCPHFLHFVPAAKTHRKPLPSRILVMEAFPTPSSSQAHGTGRQLRPPC